MSRFRLLRAVAVTGVVAAACFIAILGLLVLREGDFTLTGSRVALIEVTGLILESEDTVRQLDEHEADPAVRAIVIRIQSPGGLVAPTQEIHDAIRRVRARGKPVVASMGTVAASGGYYLAVATDHIVANPGTLTGSIGVIMQLAEVEGLLQKVGVRYQIIKAGRFKDVGHIGRPMSSEERAVLQALIDDMYEQFVVAVAEGRGLDRATVLRLADGRVYTGRRARELQLVDNLGGLDEAVRKAGELAKLPGKPKLLRPRRPFQLTDLLDWLMSRSPLGRVLTAPPGLPALPLLGSPKLPLYLME